MYILQDLFFVFPWNNFLHMHVEQCVQAVLPINPAPLNHQGAGQGRGDLGELMQQREQGEEIAKSAPLQASNEAAQSDLKALRMHVSRDGWGKGCVVI